MFCITFFFLAHVFFHHIRCVFRWCFCHSPLQYYIQKFIRYSLAVKLVHVVFFYCSALKLKFGWFFQFACIWFHRFHSFYLSKPSQIFSIVWFEWKMRFMVLPFRREIENGWMAKCALNGLLASFCLTCRCISGEESEFVLFSTIFSLARLPCISFW